MELTKGELEFLVDQVEDALSYEDEEGEEGKHVKFLTGLKKKLEEEISRLK